MSKLLFAPLFVVALALAAAPALAAGKDGACKADAKRFCANVKKGGHAVSKCLAAHADELSPACAAKLAKGKGKLTSFKQACKDDVAKLCDNVTPGEGRLTACLKQHEAKVTKDCKAVIDQRKVRREAFAAACKRDVAKHCDSAKGKKAVLACLRRVEDKLSPQCKAVVAP